MSHNLVETQRMRANRIAWKLGLTKEIINLEDNLDQIYLGAGLKPHRVVQDTEHEGNLAFDDKIISNQRAEMSEFEGIIDEQLAEIKRSSKSMCALIGSQTEFDLPIPVYVLLRLASRIGAVRWMDYKKKFSGSLSKKYIYLKTPELINTSLMMYEYISLVLGTNIIPFQAYINQNIFNILEWTRTSDLLKHNETEYFAIRSQLFRNISASIEQLSLNLNLEPKQLKTLIEDDLVSSILDESDSACKDNYVIDALSCLEKLFIVYADFLDASLEYRIKAFVVQTCIKIYRDFEKNVIGLVCRRQLLRLLETIANQPYATSTTEMAWHVFELAEMMETDPEIKCLARRALKVGLAHRPVIVSHHDVYKCYGRQMTSGANESSLKANDVLINLEPIENDSGLVGLVNENICEDSVEKVTTVPERPKIPVEAIESSSSVEKTDSLAGCKNADATKSSESADAMETNTVPDAIAIEPDKTPNVIVTDETENAIELSKGTQRSVEQVSESDVVASDESKDMAEDDPEVQSLLSCFVDKPANEE